MNKTVTILSLIVFFLASCSSGKKALQKGDYFSASLKAVERLKSSPDNKNATGVLKEGYKLALEWTQEEMDLILSSNSAFKWERAIGLMRQVNMLSAEIRSTPAARKIISNPKTYSAELNKAYERAAEERFNAGLVELNINTRESARIAFDHFYTADQFVAGYKNVRELMETSKEIATVKVVLEAIPVHTQKYRLSSEFFYNQVFEYLNNRFGPGSFVDFYSPFQAENEGLDIPDFIVYMEFYDFSVGNLTHSEKEEKVEKRVKVESKDTTKVEYKNYVARLKTFSDKVQSGGSLRVQISEPSTDKLLFDDIVPGAFTWINEYAMFVGDQEALDKKQLELTKRKAMPLPPEQDLFIEFTKPIYNQLTSKLNGFFRYYN
ncbi:MAG: hypothetical protein K0B11_05300 [Mariniphaga sp.]|nr:hypothetical protein [Mariniphaga sp.]